MSVPQPRWGLYRGSQRTYFEGLVPLLGTLASRETPMPHVCGPQPKATCVCSTLGAEALALRAWPAGPHPPQQAVWSA